MSECFQIKIINIEESMVFLFYFFVIVGEELVAIPHYIQFGHSLGFSLEGKG